MSNWIPSQDVKDEFDALIKAVKDTLTLVIKTKKDYCDAVPEKDPKVSANYDEIDRLLGLSTVFDDHIREHHATESA